MTPLDGAINSFQYTRALFRHQVTSFFFLSLLSFFFLWLIHTNATAIHRCFVTRPCAYFDDDRCNIYIRAGQTAAREPHVAREPHFYNSKIEGEEGELGHPCNRPSCNNFLKLSCIKLVNAIGVLNKLNNEYKSFSYTET